MIRTLIPFRHLRLSAAFISWTSINGLEEMIESLEQKINDQVLEGEYRSTSKFLQKDRESIKSIVAALTIKRIADIDIIKVIYDQTGTTITDRYLRTIRQQIKRESYHWYRTMREGSKNIYSIGSVTRLNINDNNHYIQCYLFYGDFMRNLIYDV